MEPESAVILAPRSELTDKFAPQSFSELLTQAKLVVKAGMAPKGMEEAGVVICVQTGAELGITPMQAIQNIAVINGRPTIFGDLGLALFNRDADMKDLDEDAADTALAQGFGRCRIEMNNGKVIERRFSIEEAKTAGLWKRSGPWTTYPGRMLQMRARWFAMRDADPGVFKGISSGEEMSDIIDGGTAVPVDRPQAIDSAEVDAFVSDTGGKSAPRARTQSNPPPAAIENMPNPFIDTIVDVKTKTGKKNNKTWKLFIATTSTGQVFTTFSSSILDNAKELGCKTNKVEIHWDHGQKPGQHTVTGVDPHVEAPAETEAADGDDSDLWDGPTDEA